MELKRELDDYILSWYKVANNGPNGFCDSSNGRFYSSNGRFCLQKKPRLFAGA